MENLKRKRDEAPQAFTSLVLRSEDLYCVRDALNTRTNGPLQTELRILVKTWKDSGPNLQAMFSQDLDLYEALRNFWIPDLYATKTGLAHLELIPAGFGRKVPLDSPEYSPIDSARWFFFELIRNPEWERLRGPCLRCGDYYICIRKPGPGVERKYCSQVCGSAMTTIPATKKKRAANHAEKLERAQKLVNRCPKTYRSEWKVWVSKNDATITAKWLTRCVNKHQLAAPL